MKGLAWGPLTIRVRLGVALAIALTPVLVLGVAQSAMAFRRDAEQRRTSLVAAAERTAGGARARLAFAENLLRTLAPRAAGPDCAARLAETMTPATGFSALIRLDAAGRTVCAAGRPELGPGDLAPWRLGQQTHTTVVRQGAAAPAILVAVRLSRADGAFDGALAGSIPLAAFKPDLSDRSLPASTQAALMGPDGRSLETAGRNGVAPVRAVSSTGPPQTFRAAGPDGLRVYVAAPLLRGVAVVISAPDQGWFSWALLNPLSVLLLPIAAFALALMAVWVVADRVVVRWLSYLDRIAALYARGRFTVRPLPAERAPPEVRALAHTLDVMAEAIAGRDQALRDHLAQKDALMREIHHRVKNNLQVISSLLNLQQRALSDPAARAAMSDTRQRIGALALIYRSLYQGPDLRRVDLRAFLQELIAQVIASEPHAAPIRTALEADDVKLDPDKLAPIALFAVEAIVNARKHAFGPQGGSLQVRFTLEGAEAVLDIADEGGRGPPPEVSEGVGRTLMNAFARQLRGHCQIMTNASGGITARLIFPAPEAPDLPKTELQAKANPAAA